MQAWFWQRFRHAAPYRLFALSNFASLLALLVLSRGGRACAHAVRPSRGRGPSATRRSRVLCAATALASTRGCRRRAGARPQPEAETAVAPSAAERALWVALSAMGSCLLLAVTNHLTQNIASIPFLWVVPLSRLPRHLHPVLRPPALVPPRRVPAGAGRAAAGHGVVQRLARPVPRRRRSTSRVSSSAACSATASSDAPEARRRVTSRRST